MPNILDSNNLSISKLLYLNELSQLCIINFPFILKCEIAVKDVSN